MSITNSTTTTMKFTHFNLPNPIYPTLSFKISNLAFICVHSRCRSTAVDTRTEPFERSRAAEWNVRQVPHPNHLSDSNSGLICRRTVEIAGWVNILLAICACGPGIWPPRFWKKYSKKGRPIAVRQLMTNGSTNKPSKDNIVQESFYNVVGSISQNSINLLSTRASKMTSGWVNPVPESD